MVNTVVVTATAVTCQHPPSCQWHRLRLLRHAGVCLHPHPSVGCVARRLIWAISKRNNSQKVCGTGAVDQYPIQQRLHLRPLPRLRQWEQWALLTLGLLLAPCWKWQRMRLCLRRCGQDRAAKNWRVMVPAPAFPANTKEQTVHLHRRHWIRTTTVTIATAVEPRAMMVIVAATNHHQDLWEILNRWLKIWCWGTLRSFTFLSSLNGTSEDRSKCSMTWYRRC